MIAHKTGQDLAGRRIAIVEDELIVGLSLKSELEDFGCIVEGPFASALQASAALRAHPLDAVLLDINLGGVRSYEIAQELLNRRIPFIFLTGEIAPALPEQLKTAPRLLKPFTTQALLEAVKSALETPLSPSPL